MEILDGKKISNDIKDEIALEVQKMKELGEKVPHLAAVIVGSDGASLTYVGSKVRACERIGFESTLVKMPSTTSQVCTITIASADRYTKSIIGCRSRQRC